MERPSEQFELRDGRIFDPQRPRWDGPLDPVELEFCRERGISVAFDCAQLGWVPASCLDEEPRESGVKSVEPPRFEPGAEGLDELIELACEMFLTRLGASSPTRRADSADERPLRRDLEAIVAQVIEQVERERGERAASAVHWALTAMIAHELWPAVTKVVEDSGEFCFRPWTDADADDYANLLDNPNVWRYLPEPYPGEVSVDLARELISLSAAAGQQASAIIYGDRPVGQCLLRRAESVGGVRCAEVAYWLGEPYWGRGWMKRVLPLFLRQSMQAGQVDVIYAWIHADHAASARVALSSGLCRDSFVFESELASALSKTRCQRYVTYRTQWLTSGQRDSEGLRLASSAVLAALETYKSASS